jgi:hypothetical protein
MASSRILLRFVIICEEATAALCSWRMHLLMEQLFFVSS